MQSDEDEKQELHAVHEFTAGELSFTDALKMFEDAKKYTDNGLRTNWDKYFKVFKGKRVIRNYEGIADISVRESHTIIETLVSNIASGYPKFSFVVTNEEQSKDTQILNEMLNYYMICNQMGLKNQEWVREMLLYGTAVLGVEWRDGEPFIFNIPLRDFFVDPTATGLVQTLNPARYAGYEYLANKKDLAAEKIYDSKEDAWVDRYDLTDLGPADKKGGSGGSGKKMDKAFKDMFNKSTLGDKATEDQVHVIKLYDLQTGRLVEIGNKKKFIYNKPTWCQRNEVTRKKSIVVNEEEVGYTQKLDKIDPFLPFAVLRDYVDSSQFYGSGEMELLLEDAEQLNDYESMQADNNAYQNTPMYWVDPAFSDLIPEIETIPGAVYPIPRNAMGTIERPQLSTDLDNKTDRILARMRRSTAADEAVQGVAQSTSRTTATEVNTQLQQATLRFSTKISNLESEGYAQLGLVIFKMVQIFVTKKTAIRIVGPMGVMFKDFDPWEYNGKWEAHVQLDQTIKQHEVEVGLKDQAVFESLKDNSQINQIELARWWVQKKDPDMTDEKFNKLILPPAPPQPSPDEIKAQTDVQKAKITAYAAMYKWAPPQVAGEIESKVDLQPDPSHVGDAHNKFLEQANQGADHLDAATRADGSVVPGMEQMLNPPEPTPASAPEGMPQPA